MVGAEFAGSNLKASASAWSQVFLIDDAIEREFMRHLAIIASGRDNVFTARLPQTRNFCASMQKGRVRLFTQNSEAFDFQSCLDLLALLNTHSRMARTQIANMQPPAFWLRPKTGAGQILPVLPLPHLCQLTGWGEEQAMSRLTPLIEDKAVRAVRCPDGTLGFISETGFVAEGVSRRFMKF